MDILNLYNSLNTYLFLGALLFGIGIYGMLRNRTFIGMLISAELILAGGSVNFMAFNRFLAPDRTVGQMFTLFVMGLAAAEASIALSIIIAVYRNFKTIDTDEVVELEG